ncbi:hypothetical protein EH240_26985 [Mesorhizobium tamadayense]|uniref:SLH domain-containing protein n=1 Tax=Mesorhizobium tamadayense TaxID=425306 RepID=A0A3P3F7I4_9HYPH|nr:hypothetical protein [Mesorhizobium tamadayense]RRH94515.1 hypothetical protein EH240_26985 [Mesorhizobium tamadayense]
MHVDFRLRSAPAPVLWILLATALPANANEGTAVFSDPARIASIAGSITEIAYMRGEYGSSGFDTLRPERRAEAVRCLIRQRPAQGCSVGQWSKRLALYGSGRNEAIDVKSVGPFIKLPEDGVCKGILEKSTSPARRSGRRQGQETRCRHEGDRKADPA